ncbi:bifunctional GMP synthase/glutamine amidotransferase protein [Besnoitia besnoiti]|uniref:GMP synthase [glutamine-hydrolyzing] n=1 Tax=Besnoitia besnoiti TaxID=94643 RepID=A0A2A9ML88_BESBE|nr:bifunctional GMP synthase/glutamine amidotransferase protein [Besnoitia besnoiti]PFH38729.1 bifunctional GMP synthase/glutamine amidotransferase protein [Besnoitia besnoiti]
MTGTGVGTDGSSTAAEFDGGRVLVLDFGSQYSHLIVRRLREIGVYSELRRCDTKLDDIKAFAPSAVILSGGPSSVYEDGSPHVCDSFFAWAAEAGVAVLGICYGMQEMCHALGGRVECGAKREFGSTWVQLHRESNGDAPAEGNAVALFAGIKAGVVGGVAPEEPNGAQTAEEDTEREAKRAKRGGLNEMLVWMSHGDKVTKIPEGFKTFASTSACPYAAIGDPARHFYGLQFHPEVTHTPEGAQLLRNFVIGIAGLKATWTMKNFLQAEMRKIREVVGDAHVIGALSGGVDSTVAAALIHKAVGDRFHGVLIDTGLLRKDEAKTTLAKLKECFPTLSIECVDASEAFLSKLKGVRDPEKKRKIIGGLFVDEFVRVVEEKKLQTENAFLLQGTLYPDVIESCSFKGPSHTIKTHHNVGGLPEKMKMKVLEPLRELFKDEVRALGIELGLPHERVYRHPFPGPGLAVRIVGEVTADRVKVLQEADAIFIQEIRKANLYDKIAQAFVVLLPDAPSVGVMGDCRTYQWTCVLRAVETTDFMTADWFRLPHDVLATCSTRIINEVKGINRVTMDVSSKPPATIEWE